MAVQIVSDEYRKTPARRGRPGPFSGTTDALRRGDTVFLAGTTSQKVGGYRSALSSEGKRVIVRSVVIDGVAGVVLWAEDK